MFESQGYSVALASESSRQSRKWVRIRDGLGDGEIIFPIAARAGDYHEISQAAVRVYHHGHFRQQFALVDIRRGGPDPVPPDL